MNNKTCGECKHYYVFAGQCNFMHASNNIHIIDKACPFFEPIPKPTNGDVIRQQVSQMNNKELTMFLTTGMCHYCDNYQTARCNPSYCEIHIEAHLNAPAESEGKDE